MQTHTGQHASVCLCQKKKPNPVQQLLSAVLEEHHGIPTLGWSLQPWPTPSYVELPRAPSSEEINQCMATINSMIRDGAPLTVDLALQGQEAPANSKIPADYQGGVVRTVQIHHPAIMERVPCCGTHLPNITFLQALHILPNVTSIRGTNVRLAFVFGNRLLENLSKSMETVRLSALELGGAEDLLGAFAAKRKGLTNSPCQRGSRWSKSLSKSH